jgi:hypothetical protein
VSLVQTDLKSNLRPRSFSPAPPAPRRRCAALGPQAIQDQRQQRIDHGQCRRSSWPCEPWRNVADSSQVAWRHCHKSRNGLPQGHRQTERTPPRRSWSTSGPHHTGTERLRGVKSGTSFAQIAGAIPRERHPCRTLIRMRSSGSSVCLHQLVAVLCVGGWDRSTVEVAAPSPAVGLGSELSLKRVRLAVLPGSGLFARSSSFSHPQAMSTFLTNSAVRASEVAVD